MKTFASNQSHNVIIPSGKISLNGILFIPNETKGLVLFVHGSGSSRLSTRNQFVARILNQANIATLLFDLLTPEEESVDDITREHRFNIPFLAKRLLDATAWINQINPNLNLGYFGASTGGGAAIIAAAQKPTLIKAVVSRGGRPDLAAEALKKIQAPTLLIVGGDDEIVIDLNQQALAQITAPKKLVIVPGATHLFEEPGKLDEVARLAKEWFELYF